MWEGKTALRVHNYISDHNTAKGPDDYKRILEERTGAVLVGMHCDDLVEEIFVGKLKQDGKKGVAGTPLSVLLGSEWESIQRDLVVEWATLRPEERKDWEIVNEMVTEVAESYDVNEPEIVDAMVRQVARMQPREVRQSIGLNLSNHGIFGRREWELLMEQPGAAEFDLLKCEFNDEVAERVRQWMRQAVLTFDQHFENAKAYMARINEKAA
jgi:hypothetical protein